MKLLPIGLILAANFCIAAHGLTQEATSPGATAPLFDEYDCSNLASDLDVLHVGQVIDGVYREWRQFFRKTNAGSTTVCVALLKPAAQQLSRTEAQAFLVASSRVGVLSPDGERQERENHQAIPNLLGDVTPVAPLRLVPDDSVPTSNQGPLIELKPHPLRHPGERFDQAPKVYMEGAKPTPPPRSIERNAINERPQVGTTDRRIRVSDTQIYPYRVVGQLIMTFKGDKQASCTATLVSPYVVLTAGHCIHSRDFGGFPEFISFAPGQYQSTTLGQIYQPYGVKYASYVVTNERWSQVSGGSSIFLRNVPYDFAAVYFSQPFTFTNTFMPVAYDDTRTLVNNAGYPGIVQSISNNGMWSSSGSEVATSISIYRGLQFREFDLDVSPGNSGGPYWIFDGANRYLTGLVSYSNSQYSGGIWVGGLNRESLARWASYTPSTLPGGGNSANAKDGLRVPLVFSSQQSDTQSLLRFGNLEATSGRVTITISDAVTGNTISRWTSPAIAPAASLQFQMQTIESQASPPIQGASYTGYSLNVESTFQGFMQHVLYNREGNSLTNVSGCDTGVSRDNSILVNVHTSRIAPYPSYILFHNVDTVTAQPELTIYDAANGAEVGTVVANPIPPDGSRIFRVSDFEGLLGFTPSASQLHFNIALGGSFRGYIEHFVDNEGAGLITNMTDKCELLPG